MGEGKTGKTSLRTGPSTQIVSKKMGSEAEQFTQMEDKIKIPKNGKRLGNPQKEMLEK